MSVVSASSLTIAGRPSNRATGGSPATAAAAPRTIADVALPTHARIRGLYIHVPFCFHKCHYCDFYSIVDEQDRQEAFVESLIRELLAAAPRFTAPLETIFIGGGTPTLLKPALLAHLLHEIIAAVPLESGHEFTIEANPETVTEELAASLASGGVNRVSIGCQSFNPVHLKTLERWHDPRNVETSMQRLRAVGITNVNLDLIFAIPGQSLADWRDDLDRALALNPSHLSCYGLTYEPNTPLTVRRNAGSIIQAEQDVEAAMYESTIDRLAAAGFQHYEISNWARDGEINRCRHNMLYWTNASWWPLGPSASGHVAGTRWKNSPRISDSLQADPWPRITDVEQVDSDGRAGEAFMLGLRLIDGLPESTIDALFQQGHRGPQRRAAIRQWTGRGLLESRNDRIRLTRRGLLMADMVLADLI